MTDFDLPAYVNPPNPKGDVILFGKGPELELLDAENGVARIGGMWRKPSYLRAYVRAAGVLVTEGAQTRTLDDISLPAFYLQRHSLELLLKRLLSWVYQYAEAVGSLNAPSKNEWERFNRSHTLSKLLSDLASACSKHGFTMPPEQLQTLVVDVESFELSGTWSRYERSSPPGQATVHHVDEEIVLPIVAFQERLETVINSLVYRFDGVEAYENELYRAWENATVRSS